MSVLEFDVPNSELDRERNVRIEVLANSIEIMIKRLSPDAKIGLDIGCQRGQITEIISNNTGINFFGIEPDLNEVLRSPENINIKQGFADDLPFPDSSFDIVTILSVIEHIPPLSLLPSFTEIFRVLKPEGYCIGQIPNMNFPIEVHSQLPFQQFLPSKIQNKYLNIFSKNKDLKTEWYRTSIKKVHSLAIKVGFKEIKITPYLYPKEVFPSKLLIFYPVLNIFPLDYVFWFKK